MAFNLFGFEIKRKSDNIESFVEPNDADGSINVTTQVPGVGGRVSSFIEFDRNIRNETELINKYRDMLNQPEISQAVDEIVNEAISVSHDGNVVDISLENLNISNSLKERIREEFKKILSLLEFSNLAYDIFLKWYVDGRLRYHVIIDEESPSKGIIQLRYIDPRKIRKIREYEDVIIGEGNNVATIKKLKNEYYIYVENGFIQKDFSSNSISLHAGGLKIAKDSVVDISSGILNNDNTMVLSHLHKAIKPLNNLRIMEDAVIIYRISRAPERRVFYIDIGNLPNIKADEYLRNMMTRNKNKVSYNTVTGEMTDDRQIMTMTDDFWLPRRNGSRGTEISTLPGGQNLSDIDDLTYFQRRLFRSLNVPLSRLESDNGFSLGRSSEITRDEVKFFKFIRRLRARFTILFDKLLEKQLILKGIITPEEWDSISDNIRYNFNSDGFFEELKEAEILRERVSMLRDVNEFAGVFYSKNWIRKNVLKQTEEDIEFLDKEIEDEKEKFNDNDDSL